MLAAEKLEFYSPFAERQTFVHIPDITYFAPPPRYFQGISQRDINYYESLYLVFQSLFYDNYTEPINCLHQWCKDEFHKSYDKDLSKTFQCNHFLLLHSDLLKTNYYLDYEQRIKETSFFQHFRHFMGHGGILFSLKLNTNEWVIFFLILNVKENKVSTIITHYNYSSNPIVSIEEAEEKYGINLKMLAKTFFGENSTILLQRFESSKTEPENTGLSSVCFISSVIRQPEGFTNGTHKNLFSPDIFQKLKAIAIERNSNREKLGELEEELCNGLCNILAKKSSGPQPMDLGEATQKGDFTNDYSKDVQVNSESIPKSAIQRTSLKRLYYSKATLITPQNNMNSRNDTSPQVAPKRQKLILNSDCHLLPGGCVFKKVIENLDQYKEMASFSGNKSSFCKFYEDFNLSYALNEILKLKTTENCNIYFPFCHKAAGIPDVKYNTLSTLNDHYLLMGLCSKQKSVRLKRLELKNKAIGFMERAIKEATEINSHISKELFTYHRDMIEGVYDYNIQRFISRLEKERRYSNYKNYKNYNNSEGIFKIERRSCPCGSFLMEPSKLFDVLSGVLSELELYQTIYPKLKFREGLYSFTISNIQRHTNLSTTEAELFLTIIEKDYRKNIPGRHEPKRQKIRNGTNKPNNNSFGKQQTLVPRSSNIKQNSVSQNSSGTLTSLVENSSITI